MHQVQLLCRKELTILPAQEMPAIQRIFFKKKPKAEARSRMSVQLPISHLPTP